jgi:tetratricopeptide (TPR) repeat protein
MDYGPSNRFASGQEEAVGCQRLRKLRVTFEITESSMKYFLSVFILAAGIFAVQAQSANEFYVRIYSTIQEADTLASNMQHAEALQKYREGQSALQTFQKGNPDWNPNIVRFRLSYVNDRIAEVLSKLPPGQVQLEKPAQAAAPADPLQGAATTALEGQVNVLRDQVRLLQAERTKLEAKLKEALAVQPAALDPRELAKAEQRILELQKENDLLKVSLEQAKAQKPVEQAATPAAPEHAPGPGAELVGAMRLENELLKKQLADRTKQPAADVSLQKKVSELETRVATLQSDAEMLRSQNKALQSKLQVLQVGPVTYTPEELALFNKPKPVLVQPEAPVAEKATPAKLSAKAAGLAREAQRDFAAGRLDQAQEKFRQVLEQSPNDVVTLGNLAIVELDLNDLDAAEKHITRAVALAPEDAFGLGVLGRLRFQQRRMDEALQVLSKGAEIDPNNAEIQNYLGLVLSEKGLRPAAESALRKAVQLRPGYGSAHQNLAVVYVTQTPPLVELARLHYGKSLAAGTPPNPALEKLIESKRNAQ